VTDLLARQARRWFGWKWSGGGVYGTAAAGLGGALKDDGIGTADGDGDIFAFANEMEMVGVERPVDADHVAGVDLVGGQKICHRINNVAFDGALEMARAVTLVGAFLQKEIAAFVGDAEKELALGSFENALLNHGEFDIENLFELFALQRVEDHDFVEAVHEFGGELAACGFDGGAFDFFVEVCFGFVFGLDEAVAATHEFGDFATAQVGGHEDNGLRKIDAAIVAESQGGFIEHAEEQLPEGVAGFFDFVEEQEREFEFIGVRSGERFLGDQRMCFAVTEIAWGRTDQFCNFVGVLKFGAIYFDDGAGVAEENFGGGFDDARFAGTGGPEEEQVAHGTARRVQASTKNLVEIDQRLHAFFLANDLGAESVMKITRVVAADAGIELLLRGCFHGFHPLPEGTPRTLRTCVDSG
jgi:hypothetical protein